MMLQATSAQQQQHISMRNVLAYILGIADEAGDEYRCECKG